MMTAQPSLGGALVSLAMLVLIVFGLRLFFLWFFKIDKMVAHLASIDQKLGARKGVETEPLMPNLIALRERLKKLMPVKKTP